MILRLFYEFAAVDDEPDPPRLKIDTAQLPGEPILKKWRLNVKEFIQLNSFALDTRANPLYTPPPKQPVFFRPV